MQAESTGEKLISICIPTYNRKEYLQETLQSIISQDYAGEFEIVIVDDGSTDGTAEMIKERGYNVRYHWQKNAGDAAARNKLIELARGKYVTFIDSDDLMTNGALARMVQAARSEQEDVVVFGPYVGIDEKGTEVPRRERQLYSGQVTQYLFNDIFIHSCGSMFPKQALVDAGGFDTSFRVCSDYDLWLRLSLRYKFVALNEPTFKRRRHGNNLSVRSLRNVMTEMEVLEKFYFNKGGSIAISKATAMKRLSKEAYRAGRCALSEKNYADAMELFRKSLQRRFNVKAAMWLGTAWAISIFK